MDTGISDHAEFSPSRLQNPGIFMPLTGGADCSGDSHGTGVASVAAGVNLGVAKTATVWTLDALCGSSAENRLDRASDALEWILNNHQTHQGPGVTNLSWGVVDYPDGPPGSGPDCELDPVGCETAGGQGVPAKDAALDSIVVDLVASGMTVVAAAGNADDDACKGSPGHLFETITVGAATPGDARLSSSNYGSCIDLFAPGQDILAADKDGGSSLRNRTSYAAPFVTGVVALYLEQNPAWSPGLVRHWLLWRATSAFIWNAGSGSPHRMLFSLVPLTATIISPHVDGPGTYKWEANPAGGIHHYDYQWYRRPVYGDGSTGSWQALGTDREQWLTLNEWDEELDIRVDVTSRAESLTLTERVSGFCDPCIESGGNGEVEQ